MDSYNLVDMRVHDINVVADLNEHDPNNPSTPPPTHDPDESLVHDGTTVGTSDEALCVLGGYIDDLFASIAGEISVWWTGWWPTLHIQISKVITSAITIDLHITVDILGNLEFDTIDYKISGYESLSEDDSEAAAHAVVESSRWALDTAIVLSAASMTLAWLAVDILADIATPLTENIFWVTLGIAMVSTFTAWGLIIWKAQQLGVPKWVRALGFLASALTLLWSGSRNYNTAAALVDECHFTRKVTDYFGDLWSWDFIRNNYNNVRVRTHVGYAFARIVCAVSAFVIFAGLWMGWI